MTCRVAILPDAVDASWLVVAELVATSMGAVVDSWLGVVAAAESATGAGVSGEQPANERPSSATATAANLRWEDFLGVVCEMVIRS